MSLSVWLIIITSFWACNDSIQEISCSEDPCATNACRPQDCINRMDSIFLSLETLWASKPGLIKGNIENIKQSSSQIFINSTLSQGHEVLCFDKHNGSLLWKFMNPNAPRYSDMHYHEGSNRLILQIGLWTTILDASNGQLISDTKPEGYSASANYGSLIGDYYYLPARSNDENMGFVLKSHVDDLVEWKEIYEISSIQVDGNRPSINSMNLWVQPTTGDEILLFQHRMAFPQRIDLVAYNLTADTIHWWHKDIEPDGNSNIRQIQIFKDRAYFQGSNTIHAVNMIDGSYQWKYYDPQKDFICCHNIVFDPAANVVVDNYSNLNQSGIMAWDADDGSVRWVNTAEDNYQAEEKIVFEGIILQADGSLDKYNTSNGRLEFALSDKERWLGFDQLIIDKEKKVLYTLFGSNGSYGRKLVAITMESISNY